MISRSQIEELRDKWQTSELNLAREHVQHVLLSALFGSLPDDVKLAFKGGTALRLLWRSPRFSEDLDFTGWAKGFHIDRWIQLAVKAAAKAGLKFRMLESYPTSGGWFALTETRVYEWPVQVEWNVSLRRTQNLRTETTLISSPLWAPYSVKALPKDEIVQEKIEALLRRKEPRDFYDLYFLLRERLGIGRIAASRKRLLAEVQALSRRGAGRELKLFLPRSQWSLIKQLPMLIEGELSRL